ncbi:hypothetical protein FQN60_008281, partial [Etheostoma spectabile]
MDYLKPPDSPDSGPSSSDTGGTTYSAPVGLSGRVSGFLSFSPIIPFGSVAFLTKPLSAGY